MKNKKIDFIVPYDDFKQLYKDVEYAKLCLDNKLYKEVKRMLDHISLHLKVNLKKGEERKNEK